MSAITGTDSITRRKFVVEIDLMNSAFGEEGDDWEAATEVARILRNLSTELYGGVHPRRAALFDVNGGRVGQFEFKEETVAL